MVSFKGILKYLIYFFIAGWMFVLGIMVGRGSSPVEFDTHKFQKRLETIAGEFGEKKVSQKINLKFYDVLDRPVAEESVSSKKQTMEIIPRKEPALSSDAVPKKISRKKLTFKHGSEKYITGKHITGKHITGRKLTEKQVSRQPGTEPENKPGKYTIQIAAYKEFKDAVTQMAALEKKGFSSYRIKGKKDGQIWYRIRTGSFISFNAAKKFKEKLGKAGIKSIIIKKEK